MQTGFLEKFSDQWTPDLNSGCWLWLAAKTRGYGVVWWKGRVERAHRAAFEDANGDGSASGLTICHHCDNPSCINPEHLFGGTPKDNVHDAIKKGRFRGGGRPKGTTKVSF